MITSSKPIVHLPTDLFYLQVDDYTPLQRPEILDTAPRVVSPELSEPEQSAEDSESEDSDEPCRGQKKQKLKPSLLNRQQQARPKKYNVWSSGIQEEVLTQELTNCEVAQRYERSRDIESYDYTRFRQPSPDDFDRPPSSNKRHYDDRQFQGVKARLGRRRGSADSAKGPSRAMLSLVVTAASSDEEVAKDIANKLCEEKEDLICKLQLANCNWTAKIWNLKSI